MIAQDESRRSKALALADALNSRNGNATGFGLGPVCDEAAAELRRLHALNAQMLEALQRLKVLDENGLYREEIVFEGSGRYAVDIDAVDELSGVIDAAIDAAKDQA